MQVFSLVRYSRVVSAALAVLSICLAMGVSVGGAFAASSRFAQHSIAIGPGPRPQLGRSFLDPMAFGKPLIFDVYGYGFPNVVYVYLQASPNTLVGQISDPSLNVPLSVATDVSGNVYVANSYGTTVSVFSPPYINGATRVLQAPGFNPQGVAVSSKGIVAVPSFCDQVNCQTTYVVSFFPKGATTPCKIIPLAPPAVAGAISFDHAGDAFVGGQLPGNNVPYVAEIKGGCAATKAESLTVNNKLGQVFDAHVTKRDELALLDANAGNIYTYKLPVRGSLGNPISTTATPGAFNFAFVASGRDLFATIGTLTANTVTAFTYPAGRVEDIFNTQGIGDVAVWPPVVPCPSYPLFVHAPFWDCW